MEKAAEGSRTPRPGGGRRAAISPAASWSAAWPVRLRPSAAFWCIGNFCKPVLRFDAGARAGSHFGAEEITELDGLGKIIDLVAMLPVYPNIFDTDVTAITGRVHFAQKAGIVNDIFLEGGLQSTFARAASMEMGRI